MDYLVTNAVPAALEQRVWFVKYLFSDDFNNMFDELYALMPPRLTKLEKQRVTLEAAVNAWVSATHKQMKSFMNVIIELPHAGITLDAAESEFFPLDEQVAAFNAELKALRLKEPMVGLGAALSGGAVKSEQERLLTSAQRAFGVWLQQPVDAVTTAEMVKHGVALSLQSQNSELPPRYQVRHLLLLVAEQVLTHASMVHPVTLQKRRLNTLAFNELTDLQMVLYTTARTILPLPAPMEQEVFEAVEQVINLETIESSKEVLDAVTKSQKERVFLHLFFGYLQLSGQLRDFHTLLKLAPSYVTSWKAFRQFFDRYESKKAEDTKGHEGVREAMNNFTSQFSPNVYAFDPMETTNFTHISELYQNMTAGMQNRTLSADETAQLNELNSVYSLLQQHKDAPLDEVIEAAATSANPIAPETLYRILPSLGLYVRMDTVWDDLLQTLYLNQLVTGHANMRVAAVNETQAIDLKAVKRLYRPLSLKLHPDKNPSPEARELFERLSQVMEVFAQHKDAAAGEIVDAAVQAGIPDQALLKLLPHLGVNVELQGPQKDVVAVKPTRVANMTDVDLRYSALAAQFQNDPVSMDRLNSTYSVFQQHPNATAGVLVKEARDAGVSATTMLRYMPLLGVEVEKEKAQAVVPVYTKEFFENSLGLGYNKTTNTFFQLKTPDPQSIEYAVNVAKYVNATQPLNGAQRVALEALVASLQTFQQEREQTREALEPINLLFTPHRRVPRSAEMNIAKGEFLNMLRQHGDDDELQNTLNVALGATGPPMSPDLPFFWTQEWLFKAMHPSDDMSFPGDEPVQPRFGGCTRGASGFSKLFSFSLFDSSNEEGPAATGSGAGPKPYTSEFVENLVKLKVFKNKQEAYARLNETFIPDEDSVAQTVVNNTIVTNFPVRYTVKHQRGVLDRGVFSAFDFASLPPQFVRDWTPPAAPGAGPTPGFRMRFWDPRTGEWEWAETTDKFGQPIPPEEQKNAPHWMWSSQTGRYHDVANGDFPPHRVFFRGQWYAGKQPAQPESAKPQAEPAKPPPEKPRPEAPPARAPQAGTAPPPVPTPPPPRAPTPLPPQQPMPPAPPVTTRLPVTTRPAPAASVQTPPPIASLTVSDEEFFPHYAKDVNAVDVGPGYTDMPVYEIPAAFAQLEEGAWLSEYLKSMPMPTVQTETADAADLSVQTSAQADSAQVLATAARFTTENASAVRALDSAFEAAALNTTGLAEAALDTITQLDAHVAPHAYSFYAIAQHALNASTTLPPAAPGKSDVASHAQSMLANVSTVMANTTVQALANAEQLNRQVLIGNTAEVVRAGQVLENLVVTVVSNMDSGLAIAPRVRVEERAAAAQMNVTTQQVFAPLFQETIVALAHVSAQHPVAEQMIQNLTSLSNRLDALVSTSTAQLPPGGKVSFKAISKAIDSAHTSGSASKLVVTQLVNASRGAMDPQVLTGTVRVMTNTRVVNKLKTLAVQSAQQAALGNDMSVTLQSDIIPAFLDAVRADALSPKAQRAAFQVYSHVLQLQSALLNTVAPLQTFNGTISSLVGAPETRVGEPAGDMEEAVDEAAAVLLAQSVDAMTNMTAGDNSIYTALRANDSFMTGNHENRYALLTTTRAQTRELNNTLQQSLNKTLAGLSPLLESAQAIMYGRHALDQPSVQQFVDDQVLKNATMLQLLPTNATLDTFFTGLSDALGTAIVDNALTPNQTLYALGKVLVAVTPEVQPEPLPVIATQVCTLAEKEIDQCFPVDKPLQDQAARLLAGVTKNVVATIQQAAQGTSTLAKQLAVETSAMVEAERVFVTQTSAALQETLANVGAEVQEEVRQAMLTTTREYLQPAMAHLVQHGARTVEEANKQVNTLVRALPVLQTVLQRRALVVSTEVTDALKGAYELALRAGSATLQSGRQQVALVSEAGGELVMDASVKLHAIGTELVQTSMTRMAAFTTYTQEHVASAADTAQVALQDGVEQLQRNVAVLRDSVVKDSAQHNLYLRQQQQRYGVGMVLYDPVVTPGAAHAFTTRLYENITGVAEVALPAQTPAEQALVRSYWGSIFDLHRGGTAMFSSDEFVNFTRDNATSLIYTPLLPPSTSNNPGVNNPFLPMVPYTGMFQDAGGEMQGTVVYVPVMNSGFTIPVFLEQHAVDVALPARMQEQLGSALAQLGKQPAVPELSAVHVMQQSRNADIIIRLVTSLLPAGVGEDAGALVAPEDAAMFLVTEVPSTVDVPATLDGLRELKPQQLHALLHGLQQYKQRVSHVQAVHERGVTLTSGVFYPESKLFPHEVLQKQITVSFTGLHEAATTYAQLHPGTVAPVDLSAVKADLAAARAVLQASRVVPGSTLDLVAASAHIALTRQLVQQEERLDAFAAVLAATAPPAAVALDMTPAAQEFAIQQLLVQSTKFHLALRKELSSQVATAVKTVNVLQETRTDLPLQESVQTTNALLDTWVKNNETMSLTLFSQLADKQVQLQSLRQDVAPAAARMADTLPPGRTYFDPPETVIQDKIDSVLHKSPRRRAFMAAFAAPAVWVGAASATLYLPGLVGPAAAAYVTRTESLKGLQFMQNLLGIAAGAQDSNYQTLAQLMQTFEYLHANDRDALYEFALNSNLQSYISEAGEFILRTAQRQGEAGVAASVPLWQSAVRQILNFAPEERLRTYMFNPGLLNTVERYGGLQALQLKMATAMMKNKAAFLVGGAQVAAALAFLEEVQFLTGFRVGPTGWVEVASELLDVGRVVKDEVPALTKNREDLKATLQQATTRTLVDEETGQPWHPAKQMHLVAGLYVAIADVEQQMVSALKVQQTGPLTAAPLAAFSANVQTLVDNVAVVMTAATKVQVRGAAVQMREDMRQDVEGVMTYLQRFTSFLADVPDKDKGFGLDEVLKFSQTPVTAAQFQPNLDDVRKLAAGDRSTYVQARDTALDALAAIRARVSGQYESQTGRSIEAAVPTGINRVFQHPVDKETYTVLQNLQRLEASLGKLTL